MIANLYNSVSLNSSSTIMGQRNNDDTEFGIEKFAALTSLQQRQTMDNHVLKIKQMLQTIQQDHKRTTGNNDLDKLCIQALEWADPHRTPDSCFGECSIDLKQRWRLVKTDDCGNVTMCTEWFTAYTIALGNNFDDPRVPMHASDIWATVSDKYGDKVTSTRLSKVLANATEHYAHQGLDRHASLKKFAKILVACRSSLVWTPNDDQVRDGWSVETMFSEFCYQDSSDHARKNGPTSFGIVFGPKGSACYSGYPGQLDMPYKLVDKTTNKLMDHHTKVFASDRTIDKDGSVRVQTQDEKIKTLSSDASRAVQIKIGVNGMSASSNLEMAMFGIQQTKHKLTDVISSMGAFSISRPWLVKEIYKTHEEIEQDRLAAQEQERKRKEQQRLQTMQEIKESCQNVSTRPYLFCYYRDYLLQECTKYDALEQNCTEWITKADALLETARIAKLSSEEEEEEQEDWVDIKKELVTAPPPSPQSMQGEEEDVFYNHPCHGVLVNARVTDDELGVYKYDDLDGKKHACTLFIPSSYTLSNENIDQMDQKRKSTMTLVKNGKDPALHDNWFNDLECTSLGYRSLVSDTFSSKDESGNCTYRSLGSGGANEFEEGEIVEAELGLSKATGRSMRLSVSKITSEEKDVVLTLYSRWALPFGTVPSTDFLERVVSNLLSMWKTCEPPPNQGAKGPKTSFGLVESRHCKKALKMFTKGNASDEAQILSSLKHYSTNAKDMLPAEDTSSDDEDKQDEKDTCSVKVQKTIVKQSPSSSSENDDDVLSDMD